MTGIRHLYYQRIYIRVARMLGVMLPATGRPLSGDELEALRMEITDALASGDYSPRDNDSPFFTGALWGWNFGFGFAQSGHRLHASHQMIHQQNAMIPESIVDSDGDLYPCFSCGDLVADFIQEYKTVHGTDFFAAFIKAVENNQRTDMNPDGPNALIVWENEKVMLFAPKAQVSEWELMLMTKAPCPHVLCADTATRNALDTGIRIALQTLEILGAQMVTSVEFQVSLTVRSPTSTLCIRLSRVFPMPRYLFRSPDALYHRMLSRGLCFCLPKGAIILSRQSMKTFQLLPFLLWAESGS
ncbi:MAG: hypothetical protein R2861_15750 [Desulfobacterales bacterium]